MILFCGFFFFRSPSSDVENPGNNLYVTGLSHRITRRELGKHFSAEGTVCRRSYFLQIFSLACTFDGGVCVLSFLLVIEFMDYFLCS